MIRTGFIYGTFLAAVLCCSGVVAALDFNDMVMMKQNNIDEAVIVDMIRDSGGVALTTEQETHLRAIGASESLLAAVRESRPATPEPMTVVTPAQPVAAASRGPVPVTTMASLPPRYAKEGWISVSNSGWEVYYLVVDQRAKRIFLSQTPNGGQAISPGENIALNIRKEGYKMYGGNGREIKVKVRENEVTRITLTPFDAPGGGLTVAVQDREKIRSEVLFGVVATPPSLIFVEPEPVFMHPRPFYGPPYWRHSRPFYGPPGYWW